MNFRQPNEDLFEQSRMSFGDHLEELRKVLVNSLLCIAIGCVFGFLLANTVVRILTKPLADAIAEYNEKDAFDDIVAEQGFVAPELLPWLEQEKLIPHRMRVDPAQLVAALQTVVPNFAEKVDLDPYGFRIGHFQYERLPQLCLLLSTQSSGDIAHRAQAKLIWEMLTPAEQQMVSKVSAQPKADPLDAEEIVKIFNRLSFSETLSNAAEFEQVLSDHESGLVSFFLGEQKAKPLAKMKAKLDETSDPNILRRLNRALLTGVFSSSMHELKMDLVAIELWGSSEFEPQSLSASEPFMAWMKAGILSGMVFAGPFVFYFLWSFVASGLYPHEQKYVHIFLPISILLFVCGVLLAFFFVFQPVLGFLFSFNRTMGIAPQMRINDWLSFVMFLPLGFGVAFQLPLVMLFMNRIGLFSVADYINKWRIAVMIIFVVSMILTPADPISMLLMALPLTVLYFLGILMCKWMPKNQNPFGEQERTYTT